MTKVCILGCGPSGLLAAHALDGECEVDIKSIKSKSFINGAQYLHTPISGVTEDEDRKEIHYVKLGTREGYARKVYGSPNSPVSWANYQEGAVGGWSLRAAYDRLWQRYEERIDDLIINAELLDRLAEQYNAVFCSLPRGLMCTNTEHRFRSQNIYISNTPVLLIEGLVVYDGRPEVPWYRASCLDGKPSIEWSADAGDDWPWIRDGDTVTGGYKPTSFDCDCHSDLTNLVRIGRFGRWDKKVLTHDAYKEARDALHVML